MKKFNSISLFTGIGGFDKGAMKAGFNSVYQSDIWEVAQAAFLNNHISKNFYHVDDYRNTHGLFDVADIRHQSAKTISDYYFNETKHSMPDTDLILTGSVCQNISAVNPKRNNFNGKNRLMIHQLRVIDDLKPKVALCEQVTGLNHFTMKPLRKLFESNLDSMNDYSWQKEVLNAKDFGSGQERQRIIYMLVRKDVGTPSFPASTGIDETKYLNNLFPQYYHFSGGKKDDMRKSTYRNFFYTMTSQGNYYFYDKEGKRFPVTIKDKLILSELEGYNLDGISEKDAAVLLGNMVQISFAEKLCTQVQQIIS